MLRQGEGVKGGRDRGVARKFCTLSDSDGKSSGQAGSGSIFVSWSSTPHNAARESVIMYKIGVLDTVGSTN